MDIREIDNMSGVPQTKASASQMNALSLAFVGDGVHTLYVRGRCIKSFDLKANKMDAYCRKFVSAKGQVVAFNAIEPLLDDTEQNIARRARNSHPSNSPKNATQAEYMIATAFEAVIGFLYACEDYERLSELLELSFAAVCG